MHPGEFLPAIENTPLEIALGEWAVDTGLRQLRAWHDMGCDVTLSVNICPRHIQMESFGDFVVQKVSGYPQNVVKSFELEILEVDNIHDVNRAFSVMQRCRGLGIKFALDDFGTGHATLMHLQLMHLHRLPFDILKIDQNFVRGMVESSEDLGIVEGVVRLAQNLNRPLVAEGVEHLEIGWMLQVLGCHSAQGYAIAYPMAAHKVVTWIKTWQEEQVWHDLGQGFDCDPQRYDLEIAAYSHNRWINAIEQSVEQGDSLPDMDEGCLFHQWYKGVGAERYGSYDGYASVQTGHHEVHSVALEIEALLEASRRDAAKALLPLLKERADALIDMT